MVCGKGWQVLSIDLPEHGQRSIERNTLKPWQAVPELQNVMQFLERQWKTIGLRANSLGVWFSLLAFEEVVFEKCLFVSPILDMELLIGTMMKWSSVSEETLRQRKEIPTEFGETLSWEYLAYTREHPILKWPSPTSILYADKDNLTERWVVDAFCTRFHSKVSVFENGEHWFHTADQLAVLDQWTKNNI